VKHFIYFSVELKNLPEVIETAKVIDRLHFDVQCREDCLSCLLGIEVETGVDNPRFFEMMNALHHKGLLLIGSAATTSG
jgi:hypothetical protein